MNILSTVFNLFVCEWTMKHTKMFAIQNCSQNNDYIAEYKSYICEHFTAACLFVICGWSLETRVLVQLPRMTEILLLQYK